MTSVYLFDMDGTLTEARKPVDKDFEKYLQAFTDQNACYIVTGSDYQKVEEQLGNLLNNFEGIFTCSGNQLITKGSEIHKNPWQLSKEQEQFLLAELDAIDFPNKTGNHLEKRIGSANLSIPGRSKTVDFGLREQFIKWNSEHQAREKLAEKFNNTFPELEAVLGGDTGLDIFQRGKDKAQVVKHFSKSNIHFFGDRCNPGGNDYTIAVAVSNANGTVHQVKNWQHTHEILKSSF